MTGLVTRNGSNAAKCTFASMPLQRMITRNITSALHVSQRTKHIHLPFYVCKSAGQDPKTSLVTAEPIPAEENINNNASTTINTELPTQTPSEVPTTAAAVSSMDATASDQQGEGCVVYSDSSSSCVIPQPQAVDPPKGASPMGIKIKPFIISCALGLAIRFLIPIPEGLTAQAWSLLAIFTSTIAGLVLDPMPVGAWAFLMLTFTLVTKTLTFQAAFSAMTNEVIWLIVVSFFFAKGFEKTGLGDRIANMFVRAFGKSTLGLSMGLNIAEMFLSPAMPSTSARAGGIFVPIIKSLSAAAGSNPGDESRKKMGAYLMHSQFQTGVHSTSLFLTASAQNFLCLKMAAELGAVVPDLFCTWFMGSLLPTIVGMVTIPLLLYKLVPPTLTDTPEAPKAAAERLAAMGPLSRDEKVMLGATGIALALWVGGETLGVSAVLAAMVGLSVLLVSGILKWSECLSFSSAWDTLTWFAVLIGMSAQLNAMGVISAFSTKVTGMLTSMSLEWPAVFAILHLAFFTLHYLFASQTAHVGALYAAFCSMMLTAGVPPILAAMTLTYSVNLFGSLTHYASGQAAVFYGSGFMRLKEVFSVGAICGFVSLAIWACVGMPWWKFLGWY